MPLVRLERTIFTSFKRLGTLKFILSIGVILIVFSMLTLVYFSNKNLKLSLIAQFNARQNLLIDQLASRITTRFYILLNEIKTLEHLPSIKTADEKYHYQAMEEFTRVWEVLSTMTNSICRYDKDGRLIYAYPQQQGNSFNDLRLESNRLKLDSFELVKGQGRLCIAAPLRIDENSSLIVTSPLYQSTEFSGVLILDVNWSNFVKPIFDTFNSAQSGNLMILNQDADIIYYSIPSDPLLEYGPMAIIFEMVSDKNGNDYFVNRDGKKVYVSYAPIHLGDTLWSIALLTNEDVISGSFGKQLIYPYVLVLFSIGIILLMARMIYIQYQRMSELTEIMQEKTATLQEQNIEIKEADRLKTEFVANMSHELRTPLNSIIGFSKVLLKGIDGKINNMQRTDITTILNSGEHLLGLINDILDLSKIESGKIELEKEEIDVGEVIKSLIPTSLGLIKGKDLTLRTAIQSQLPKVIGDKTKISQIILNLLSNAIKFTDEGEIVIRANRHSTEPFLVVSVKDSGIGISKENIKVIFDEFRQVDGSSTRREGGTGLGLAITRKFVEMHGGSVWVKSDLGIGSTFLFTLPIKKDYRPETDRSRILELKLEEIDVGEILKSLMATGLGLITGKDLTLRMEADRDLPKIIGDGIRVRQIILNLLSNAAKFTDKGDIIVRAHRHEEDPFLVISVEDNGFTLEKTPVKFDKLLQPGEDGVKEKGVKDLGLSITKNYVEMHGGAIWIESDPGAGSTVSFTLPVKHY